MTVSRAAFALGYAGLLPPLAAVAIVLVRPDDSAAALMGLFGYALLILSFLGGMWWTAAVRRSPERQLPLLLAAVTPSLVAFAIYFAASAYFLGALALIAAGVAVLLTLLVDRRLVRTGEMPADWMRLRVPLSLGLGSLCILAGVLAR